MAYCDVSMGFVGLFLLPAVAICCFFLMASSSGSFRFLRLQGFAGRSSTPQRLQNLNGLPSLSLLLNALFNLFIKWAASSEFGTYRLCEQRRFRRDCASAQSRQNHRCSLIQAVNQEEPSDRNPNPWPL